MSIITMTTLDAFREVADRAVSDWGYLRVYGVGHAFEGPSCNFRQFVVFGVRKEGPSGIVVDRYTGPIEASAL